jgi:hypothetical protein
MRSKGFRKNNATTGFSSVQDIMQYLREQWAGLFQRFLQERETMKQINIVRNMQATVDTLNQLVDYLTEEKRGSDETIKWILTQHHPIFARIAKETSTPYRVFFTNRQEMETWLRGRGWTHRSEGWEPEQEWSVKTQKKDAMRILCISTAKIFDDNQNLRVITPDNWDDEWVTSRLEKKQRDDFDDLDDEIPF